jgi:hypothetical protein
MTQIPIASNNNMITSPRSTQPVHQPQHLQLPTSNIHTSNQPTYTPPPAHHTKMNVMHRPNVYSTNFNNSLQTIQ